MDNLEKKIKDILKKEVSKPLKYEYKINNAFIGRDKKTINKPFYKIATITCCSIFAISGIVGATYTIYEKIWKTPTLISQEEKQEEIEKVKKPITTEEKEKIISNEKAIEISNNILETLGYEKTSFKKVDIIRGYDEKTHYVLNTENDLSKGITINLNTLTGNFEYFCDNSTISKNIKCDDISKEEAINIANTIYKKLNIIQENDKYEIMSAQKSNMASGNNINEMWQVTYALKYNNNFDTDSAFSTAFSVVNGKTIIYIIKGKNENNFENNSIVLTKEEAIEIATKKEKEFSSLEISEVTADLSIQKMNIFIYALENNITNSNGEYKVDDIIRNVWVVEIKHNKENKPRNTDIETVKELYDKKYFIDASTGEIIGGEQAEYFDN